MKLYSRDFNVLTEEELQAWEIIKEREVRKKPDGTPSVLSFSLSHEYPEAVRHYESLFPNNSVDAIGLRKRLELLKTQLDEFKNLIDLGTTTERDVLNFIKDNEAYFIIGSILKRNYRFGHHSLYVFPELMLYPNFRVDYLLVGKNSGGHEFVFVELENIYNSITKADGYFGGTARKGLEQIEDWDSWIDSDFDKLELLFEAIKSKMIELPTEFRRLDKTRIHYCVVTGRRNDFNETTYRQKRKLSQNYKTLLIHYDNLIDFSNDFIKEPIF
ncbi:DUF4263 domain-containing protein [Chitinophaga sp. SYP-B3965]|uniref:Shedu anti-phage system protein SduA domain-containing protein n=1 Tax=Chitinophaga sp. SYP-B3965 TaxID=2663120 RepID=UPI001299F888|nr:Shedu anti-phage system protein SduA domain-containing protein [Chitinophaga sp. SYP-B3965]MRG45356.1 DUF4263 domain-containing protein [Chitinophaga sp. SYP-B3965]